MKRRRIKLPIYKNIPIDFLSKSYLSYIMISAKLPENEIERLKALERYDILDTNAEADFDELVKLASQICDTPISLVSLIDSTRQWFKAKIGIESNETSREVAFCAHGILKNELMEINDATQDNRFYDNPLVTGDLGIKFYAGMPLTTSDGFNLGTLCVIDTKPKVLSDYQKEALKTLGKQVIAQLELRYKLHLLSTKQNELEDTIETLNETRNRLIETERVASLGQLVAGLAHEINNPISVIKANVQIINERIYDIIEHIPKFLETLEREEKSSFYEIITTSVKNNEVLSTKEERERKKIISKELEEYENKTNLSLELIADSILRIKLKPPYKKYIDVFGMEKFNKSLEMANIFVSKKNSIFNVNFAINRVSRIIFSLRTYLDTVTYQKLKTININDEIEKSLILYDVTKNFKIEINRNYIDEINYTCISENLIQVFNNFIFNSIQSMYESKEKKITITIQKVKEIPIKYNKLKNSREDKDEISNQIDSNNGFILVEFTDTGIGIPMNLQDRVFTAFFTTKKLGEGIGLGLYVSQKIINEIGGTIYFESREGFTSFSIFLPLLD